MKKITVIFSILFLTFTGTVSAQDREQFDKAGSKKFKKIEQHFDVYLSGEVIFTNPKFDTIITFKNGRPIEIVKDLTTTAKIRYKEVGTIDHWEGDSVCWVSFSTEDKQVFLIPFRPSAAGPGNDNNPLIIRMDRKVIYQADGSAGSQEETNYVTLAGKQWTLSDNSVYLEYEPVLQQKEKKTKLVSKGNSTKKKK